MTRRVEGVTPTRQWQRRLAFEVVGTAIPQGSMISHRIGNKVITRHGSKVLPWRLSVATAARQALPKLHPLLEGPIGFHLTIYRPRPKTTPKLRRDYPATRPDLSKQIRAIEDALNAVVWRDDGQVVWIDARQEYGEPARAEIEIWEYAET